MIIEVCLTNTISSVKCSRSGSNYGNWPWHRHTVHCVSVISVIVSGR